MLEYNYLGAFMSKVYGTIYRDNIRYINIKDENFNFRTTYKYIIRVYG